MYKVEYERLQDEFSKLISLERVHRKYPHSGYADAYKRAVLDCKSKLHAFYKHQNEISQMRKRTHD